MTFKTLRRLSLVAIVLNMAFAFIAMFWVAMRIRAFVQARPPWPLWQDFELVAAASSAAVAAFTFLVLLMCLTKTKRGPEFEALRARGRQEIRDLEIEVQRAELQKRLRDLTTPR